jgi:biotin carboxylase/ferredoxin-NADP reductase
VLTIKDLQKTHIGRYLIEMENNIPSIHEGQCSLAHGFAPATPIPAQLPPAYQQWDALANTLPCLLRTFNVRSAINKLPILDAAETNKLPDHYLSRASVILAALAHAYYYHEKDQDKISLPESLLLPWSQVCRRIGRANTGRNNFDTFLCNWKLKKSLSSPSQLKLDDFELLIPVFDNQEERIFNLTIFLAEWRFSSAFEPIILLLNALKTQDDEAIVLNLSQITTVIEQITKDLDYINPNEHSPYYVDPVVWTKTVARFDEAVLPDAAGVSGALSPLFHCMDTLLERKNFNSLLGKDILGKRRDLAPNHLKLLSALQNDLNECSLHHYVTQSHNTKLKNYYRQLEEAFSGIHGWQGRHKQKVLGYMKLNFRAGRLKTNGGQRGTATPQTEPALELDNKFSMSMQERLPIASSLCPFARVSSNTPLANHKANKVSFDVSLAGIHFNIGDRCEVFPKNNEEQVQHFYKTHSNQLTSDTVVLNKQWITYFSSVWHSENKIISIIELLYYVDLSALEHCEFNSNTFIDKAKPLQPRPYSISTNTYKEVSLTVGKCTYLKGQKEQQGVASSFLLSSQPNELIPIRKFAALHFNVPSSIDTPIVMCAGGTGISPFIGFIQTRIQNIHGPGLNWLFYSTQNKESLLYKQELTQWADEKKIVFSPNYTRETEGYAIDVSLQKNAKELIELLITQKCHFYICGSMGFAETIKKSIVTLLQTEKGMDEQSAQLFITERIANKTFQVDAFSSNKYEQKQSYTIVDACLNGWTIIDNGLYDLTGLFATHEGGKKILKVQSGLDSTNDFLAVHGNHPHVKMALQQYYQGLIKQPSLNKHPRYSSFVNFLHALQEMINTLDNNSHFKSPDSTPIYLWTDIYLTFLVGPFQYTFNELFSRMKQESSPNDITIQVNWMRTHDRKIYQSIIQILGATEAKMLAAKEDLIRGFYKKIIHNTHLFLYRLRELSIHCLKQFEASHLDEDKLNVFIKSIQTEVTGHFKETFDLGHQFLLTQKTRGSSMKYRKTTVVIIDGLSNGRFLAPAFIANGYNCIHVQTPFFMKSHLAGFNYSLYNENIIADSVDEVLRELKKYAHILAVIPGSESAVLWADALSEQLGLSNSNGTLLSEARRNKFIMQETIKKQGLDHIAHFKARDVESILEWIAKNTTYPVVMKPIQSAGTEGFYLCQDEAMIRTSFKAIYQHKDIFQQVNEEVLVQKYIEGQEYSVNFVSCNGKHFLSEIWKVDKTVRYGAKMYELTSLLPQDATEYQSLKLYAEQVLNAIGIKYGPSHCEVIIDNTTKKPVLVEVAARLMGGVDFGVVAEATGTNAAVVTAEAYLSPETFAKRFDYLKHKKHVLMVQLLADDQGVFESIDEASLQALPTLKGYDIYLNPGDLMQPTRDLFTCPGLAFLVGEHLEQMNSDYAAIRAMEKSKKLYRLTAAKTTVYSSSSASSSYSPLTFKPASIASEDKDDTTLGCEKTKQITHMEP